MKKTKLIGLAAILLSLGIVGCGENPDNPGGDSGWKSDKTNHWHEVDGEGGEVEEVDKAKHTFEEDSSKAVAAKCEEKGKKVDVCTVCGFEKESDVKATGHTYVEQTAQSEAATCEKAGKKVEKCSICEDVRETEIKKLDHTFAAATDADHQSNPATCSAQGYHWEQCSLCKKEWKKVEEGYAEHKWGAAQELCAKSETSAKVTKKVCPDCDAIDIIVDAMSWTATGTTSSNAWANKDTSGETLKMSKNGNYCEYSFELPAGIDLKGCDVYLYGFVDYWKDGSNNNDQKGHIVSGSATFSVTVNDAAVQVTDTRTFEEMGMTDAQATDYAGNPRGTYTLCPLGGTADLASGAVKVVYSRLASYNLNITEIHFIKKGN